MTNEVASYLKNQLLNLSFVDVVAGLVQTVRTPVVESESDQKGELRMPVGTDVIVNGACDAGAQYPLVPDSTKKGILYFEDGGTTVIQPTHRGRTRLQSRLTLVCWMNRERITGQPYSSLSMGAAREITQAIIGKNPVNWPPFIALYTRLESVAVKDANIFSKYTYPEDITQYLMPPFDYFALNLACSYYVTDACQNSIQINPSVCSI